MKIILITPHPDDETLGCGGTILRHTKEGEEVHWLIMSTLKSKTKLDKKNMKIREKQIRNVAKAYNFSSYHQTNFETAKLDTYPKIDLINENERRRNSMLGNFQFPAPTALVTKINDFRNHTP